MQQHTDFRQKINKISKKINMKLIKISFTTMYVYRKLKDLITTMCFTNAATVAIDSYII